MNFIPIAASSLSILVSPVTGATAATSFRCLCHRMLLAMLDVRVGILKDLTRPMNPRFDWKLGFHPDN